MNTESLENTNESTVPATDFKEIYQQGVDDDAISVVAKTCASKVLERLTSIKPHTSSTVITDKMQAAITANDLPEIIRLAKQLEALKQTEDEHIEKLVTMSEEYRFDELLAAYPTELESLAFELATIAMHSVQEAMTKTKKRDRSGERRSRPVGKTYVLSLNGKSMDIVPNVGAPASPGKERELFTFLGFTVSDDGRSLSPAVFTAKDGTETPSMSKKAIIEDILAGGSYWIEKGYTIVEKPAQAKETDSKAA